MDPVRIHTYVGEERVRTALVRGSVIGGLGISLLLSAAVEIPLGRLQVMGIPIFLFGLVLIGFGLIPYQQLKKLRQKPDVLEVTDEELHYFRGGKRTLTLPLKAITHLEDVDLKNDYGILVYVRGKVTVHDRKYKPHSRGGANLFFPAFNRASYLHLREAMALAGYSMAAQEGR
ncbi:MAG: hypothetical protein JSR80_01465 [Verrucomicrobia bacterium]|nr:hypothetical protein [Verrucomicrobiota bacterium]